MFLRIHENNPDNRQAFEKLFEAFKEILAYYDRMIRTTIRFVLWKTLVGLILTKQERISWSLETNDGAREKWSLHPIIKLIFASLIRIDNEVAN